MASLDDVSAEAASPKKPRLSRAGPKKASLKKSKAAVPLKQQTLAFAAVQKPSDAKKPSSAKGGPQTLRILSYNIDMDTPPIGGRTRSIVQVIREKRPDAILFQEVTPESFKVLASLWKLSEEGKITYTLHTDDSWTDDYPYFCIMLVRKDLLTDVESEANLFPASKMRRGYIKTTGRLANGTQLSIATSHFESLKPYGGERKNQLQTVLDDLREAQSESHAVVFAGDTNLRESEVPASEIQKNKTQPKKRSRVEKFQDAFLTSGADDEEKYTWDMQKNDNLSMGTVKPRARYDRMFYLPEALVTAKSFTLIGKERLPCGTFPSDHFGMLVDLCIQPTKR